MKVRSIRSKVLIAITGITLLTAAAMAFVFYGRSSRMIEENYITVLSQRTRLLTDTVDDMLKNVCNIDIKASCDKEIKEELEQYLNDKDEKRLNNISTRLRTFSKMDQAISSMYLVIPGESQFVTTCTEVDLRRITFVNLKHYVEKMADRRSWMIWCTAKINYYSLRKR